MRFSTTISRFLFNSYYNSIGDRTARDHRGLSRPTVKRVFEFRKHVDEKMLSNCCRGSMRTRTSVRDLVTLGLNHEQQHQELFLTDLNYTLSQNPLFPVYHPDLAFEEACRRQR